MKCSVLTINANKMWSKRDENSFKNGYHQSSFINLFLDMEQKFQSLWCPLNIKRHGRILLKLRKTKIVDIFLTTCPLQLSTAGYKRRVG